MTGNTNDIRTGSCLCGAVAFEVRGPLRPVIACHCRQCQKTSGHFVAATACLSDQLTLTNETGLKWFQSSAEARRGFCGECGGNLFYRRLDRDQVSIMAGMLDHPTGLDMAEHIYVADKSDYYEIGDGKPQYHADTPDRSAQRKT